MEENNDFRNKNNLHETLKMKINYLKEAEECIQYLKEKSKQVFQYEHHNDHSYTSYSQRPDEQLHKNAIKTKSDFLKQSQWPQHRQTNQLMPESSSTNNNSGTIQLRQKPQQLSSPKLQLEELLGKRATKQIKYNHKTMWKLQHH